MTYFISVFNQKGGVAKTTTCLSLGGCLVEMGRTVLLVDLDPQANLTASLALEPRQLARTVSDVLEGKVTLIAASQRTTVMGLNILPANASLALLDRALYQSEAYEARLKKAVSELNPGLYDYVLIDCPPSLGPLTLNALTVADLAIVPTQAEYYALKSLENVFVMIKLTRRRTNPDLRYRILVTMYDRRNAISGKMLARVRDAFDDALFSTVIDVDTKLREGPLQGKPITVYSPSTRGAQQYRALAKEVMEYE